MTEKLKRAMQTELAQSGATGDRPVSSNAAQSDTDGGGAVAVASPSPQGTSSSEGAHIEQWMPPLPAPHCYMKTPLYGGASGGLDPTERPMVNTAEQANQKRQAEVALVKLGSASKRLHGISGEGNPFWMHPRVLDGQDEVAEVGRDRVDVNSIAQAAVVEKKDVKHRPENSDPKILHAERILAESAGVEEKD